MNEKSPAVVLGRIQAILNDASFDDPKSKQTRDEAIWALVDSFGWEAVLGVTLDILRDDTAFKHWYELSVVLWRGVNGKRPMPVRDVIVLLYRRLLADVPPSYALDENLVWSITSTLKGVGYESDYDPMKDPDLQAEILAARKA